MEKFLERLALALAGLSLAIYLFLLGIYSGFSNGAITVCGYDYSPVDGVWISHSDPYYLFGTTAVFMAGPILLFLLLKLFERGWVTSLLLIAPPAAALFAWFEAKSVIELGSKDPNSYFDTLRETGNLFLAVLIILSAAILTQTAVVVLKLVERRNHERAVEFE